PPAWAPARRRARPGSAAEQASRRGRRAPWRTRARRGERRAGTPAAGVHVARGGLRRAVGAAISYICRLRGGGFRRSTRALARAAAWSDGTEGNEPGLRPGRAATWGSSAPRGAVGVRGRRPRAA